MWNIAYTQIILDFYTKNSSLCDPWRWCFHFAQQATFSSDNRKTCKQTHTELQAIMAAYGVAGAFKGNIFIILILF